MGKPSNTCWSIILGLAALSGVATSGAASPEDSDTLLLSSEIKGLPAEGKPLAEQVIAKLNASREGIFKFRITPSLFGMPVEPAATFDEFIRINQDVGLAFFHDLGKGLVQLYLPERDSIETSIPLSAEQWPTLKFALAGSVQFGPGRQWPARHEAGSVRLSGTPAFNEFVEGLVKGLRSSELPEVLVFPLKYASADDSTIDLSTSGGGLGAIKSEGVKNQLERFLYGSVGGSKNKILAHRKQNAIIIVDRPETRPYYQSLIEKLDQPRELVEITAAIIDIQSTTGLKWESHFLGAGVDREGGGTRYAGGLGVGDGLLPPEDPPGEFPLPGLVNDAGLNVATMLVGQHYRVISKIRALEAMNKAKVMSRPSVLSIENQPARITDTVTAYLTVEGERQSQLYNITGGISLTVLPRIVDKVDEGEGGRRVYLAIDVGDGDIGIGGDSEAGAKPLQTSNRITTQTILRDGESLLIGGRYTNQQNEADSGVPILKNIPIIGLPFKDKEVNNGRLQRLYLITPRILTWQEAQMREHEAAAMISESDLAGRAAHAEAEGVVAGSALEYTTPPRALPIDRVTGGSGDGQPKGRRRLFKGRFLSRLRDR